MGVYYPRWISLAQARAVLVGTEMAKQDAQSQICNALADGAVAVRVKVADSDRDVPGEVFESPRVLIPAHLQAGHLDWERSCPRSGWGIGPTVAQQYMSNWRRDPRPVVLLELLSEDVTRIWCTGSTSTGPVDRLGVPLPASPVVEIAPTGAPRLLIGNPRGRPRVKLNAAVEAMVDAVRSGEITYHRLRTMKEKELEQFYAAGRTLLREAREPALHQLKAAGYSDSGPTYTRQSSDKKPTNDK